MDHYGDSSTNPTPPSRLLPQTLVIQQWLSPVWNWANLSAITGDSYAGRPEVHWPQNQRGFQAITTNGWYLDADSGVNDWSSKYEIEPLTNQSCVYSAASPAGECTCQCPEGPWRDGACHCFDLRFDEQHAGKVLGGEACLWGEHIDEHNLLARAFPRASAVAERLWSPMHLNNSTVATPRLIKQRCRMISRSVPVTPLGPGFC